MTLYDRSPRIIGLRNWLLTGCLLLAGMSGCGPAKLSPPELPETGLSQLPEVPPEEAPLLRLYFWEDYVSTNVLAQFTERTGIQVEASYYGTVDELEAQLQEDTSAYDLVIIDDSILAHYKELKLIDEIHPEWIPNLKKIKPEFQQRTADPENRYSVPYIWGLTLLVYNKEKIPEPPTSWNDLWNPAYSGKVGLLEDAWDFASLGAYRINSRPDTTDPEEQARAMEAFKTLIPHIGQFTEFDDMLKEINAGTLWIGNNYSGDAAAFALKYPNVGYLIPKEGAMSFCDILSIPRRAQHPGNAHRFINFILEPEVSAKNANDLSFTSVVTDAAPLLDPKISNNPQLNPPTEVLARCPSYPLITFNMRKIHDEIFKAVNIRKQEIWDKGERNLPD